MASSGEGRMEEMTFSLLGLGIGFAGLWVVWKLSGTR